MYGFGKQALKVLKDSIIKQTVRYVISVFKYLNALKTYSNDIQYIGLTNVFKHVKIE